MTNTLHDHFMKEALKQAERAFEKGEVPVGAVAVYKNQIVGRAHNQTEMLRDPTAHAEMIVMTQASETISDEQKGHRGSLEGVTIYVTLEPCPMCAGAMVMSKCSNLIYGAKDAKAGACDSLFRITQDDRLNHRVSVISGVMESESRLLLQEFFRTLRKEKR